MSEKYYHPNISEFHVGFEYEVILDLEDDLTTKVWGKQECTVENIQDNLESIFEDEENTNCIFRVKHLDKEDIESLGFKFKLHSIMDWYEIDLLENPIRFHSGHLMTKVTLRFDYNNHFKKEQDVFPNVIITATISGNENKLFEGGIKNKSELEVLLKQLNLIKTQ